MRTIWSITLIFRFVKFFITVLAFLGYSIFWTISSYTFLSLIPRYTASFPAFFRAIYLALVTKVFITTVFAISGNRIGHNNYSFNMSNYTPDQELCQVKEYVAIAEARLAHWLEHMQLELSL
jgi:hypothetical protein